MSVQPWRKSFQKKIQTQKYFYSTFAASFVKQGKTTDSSNINEKNLHIDFPMAVNVIFENEDYRLRMIG